ncbi:MAG: endonuclease/exonuclease/phosphatase family protein [Pseudomonadota bacterium]|nr:endonuclease/exonuclease/phosphatase family protein [Pseudomonadota bacterium]
MLLFVILALLVIWLTISSRIPRDEWWFRVADFPRLQVLTVGLLTLAGLLWWPAPWTIWREILLIALMAAIAYQLKMVLPYTFIWKNQVKSVRQEDLNPDKQISMIVSNVLTPNRKYQKLINLVNELQPDLLLTLETDQSWQNALSVIEKDYPYRVAVPLDNLYGMHLYSKLELKNAEVKHLLSDEIPSIHASVILRSGNEVDLYCLHPQPPSPTEAAESTLRDAELLMVGDAIKDINQSCIVMGDLNDVAWSKTTRLFQRISGLLDPRVGRKFINTFHADYPCFRWSLDHVFHSIDFALVKMERLPHIGSDHFPVYTVLQTDRMYECIHEEIEEEEGDQEEADEKIQEGIEKSRTENLKTDIQNGQVQAP